MKRPELKDLTLREKIAQTLLIRQSDLLIASKDGRAVVRDPQEAGQIMERDQYGGIWAHGNVDVSVIKGGMTDNFDFDVESHLAWIKEMNSKSKYPLLCANDSSGGFAYKGLGRRLQGLIQGAANDEELSYQLGFNQGREHALAGINWLWSPVVDRTSPFMADICRTSAGDKDILISQSKAFIKGMQDAGVAACAKHFPGSDMTDIRDSHIVASKISVSYEEWEKIQGEVFQEMIDAGVYTIMSAAIAFPAVDPRKKEGKYYPGSFSKPLITGILKEKMGFDGVVISDDIYMGGYTSFYGREDLYIELIAAGNDMLLGVGLDALDILENAVKSGRITEDRIDDACMRILNLKEKLGLFTDEEKTFDYTKEEAVRESEKTFKAVAEKGITLLRDRANLIPVSKEDIKKVTIITYTHRNIMPALEFMKKAFEDRGAEVVLRDKLENFTEAKAVAEESDLIVYAGFIGHHAPKGMPSFYDDVFWSLRYAFTEGNEKSVGVSLGYPFIHHYFMDDSLCFFNMYCTNKEVMEAFVAAMYGEIKPQGISPVDMSIVCGNIQE